MTQPASSGEPVSLDTTCAFCAPPSGVIANWTTTVPRGALSAALDLAICRQQRWTSCACAAMVSRAPSATICSSSATNAAASGTPGGSGVPASGKDGGGAASALGDGGGEVGGSTTGRGPGPGAGRGE